MKILHISNRKGGVGKTTVALHAAWYFAERRRVLFVELDDQRNASNTMSEYVTPLTTSQLLTGAVELPRLMSPSIVMVPADDEVKNYASDARIGIPNLRANILKAAKGFDVCVIDSAPSATALNIGPMLFATHVLAPIELVSFSLQGVESLLKSVIGAKQQFNPGLDFLGLLPNKYVANSPDQRQALAEIFERVGTRFMFKGVMAQRQSYASAGIDKRPVWLDTKTAAREAGKEMRAIMDTIEARMWKGSAA